MARRAVVVKYIHGWLPTKDRLHKQGREETGWCPVCEEGLETQDHPLHCQNPEAVTHRLGLLNTFIADLNKVHTAPEIRHCWVSQLYKELRLGAPPVSGVVGTPLKVRRR